MIVQSYSVLLALQSNFHNCSSYPLWFSVVIFLAGFFLIDLFTVNAKESLPLLESYTYLYKL